MEIQLRTIINLILLYNLTFKNTQRQNGEKNEEKNPSPRSFSDIYFHRKITSIFPHEDLVMKYALYNHLSLDFFL